MRQFLFWFGITAIITIVCLLAGFFVVRYLSSQEEASNREKTFGPIKQRLEIMQTLVASGRLSAEEAFAVVDKAKEAPIPEMTQILDKDRKILLTHKSRYFEEGKITDFQEHALSPDRFYRVYMDPHRHMGPPPGGKHKGPGPSLFRLPPGALLVGGAVTVTSILVGIGFSILLLTFYLRKKSREVEVVMEKIKSGDLSYRFSITQTDEAGQLMGQFNEMADEIQKLVSNLRETEESRKKMLQELAHDLRTPVASVKSLQELIFNNGDRLTDEKKSHLQNLAMKEIHYFEQLVEDLLFLSGVNDPRFSQAMKETDFSRLVEEEAEFFGEKGKTLRLNITPELYVSGDELLLRRLLRNALSNAVRYAKSSVQIDLSSGNGKIKLSVSDDGPGLPENDIQTFGDKKYSRSIAHESGHISVGLGSVIMKKIMFLHNGHLSVRNTHPGASLTFTF